MIPVPNLTRSTAGNQPERSLVEASAIVKEVALRYPGVRLVSTIQGFVYLQRFADGVKAYSDVPHPTPQDARWVGVCHFQLFEDTEALSAFSRAIDLGEEAARINLAHLLRFLERGEEGTRQLQAVRVELLNEYDRVFYYRIHSLNEENNGNLREALRSAEEAWRRVQGLPEYALLAPSILAQLGVLHSRIGRAQRALWFLERAIQMTSGLDNQKARLRRSAVLNLLGRHHDATVELDALVSEGLPENFLPELHINRGEVAWAAGDLFRAEAEFRACAAASKNSQAAYEEFVARLSLCAISCLSGSSARRCDQLERARTLISDKSDRLSFRFREIHVHTVSGRMGLQHSLVEYAALDNEFGEMGLLQEQAYVKLHRAGLELAAGREERAKELLDELVGLTVTLQNRAFLAREWTTQPSLRNLARRTHPSLLAGREAILQLHTLGAERIVLAGNDVRMPLRRSAELLAYFMEHKSATFEQVRADLFPDEKQRTAKSYFHQFRHQLKERIAGLEIAYDRETRHYRLRSEMDVMWDVADLRAGRRQEAAGPFLPSCTSDWALTLDHTLERYRPVR